MGISSPVTIGPFCIIEAYLGSSGPGLWLFMSSM